MIDLSYQDWGWIMLAAAIVAFAVLVWSTWRDL